MVGPEIAPAASVDGEPGARGPRIRILGIVTSVTALAACTIAGLQLPALRYPDSGFRRNKDSEPMSMPQPTVVSPRQAIEVQQQLATMKLQYFLELLERRLDGDMDTDIHGEPWRPVLHELSLADILPILDARIQRENDRRLGLERQRDVAIKHAEVTIPGLILSLNDIRTQQELSAWLREISSTYGGTIPDTIASAAVSAEARDAFRKMLMESGGDLTPQQVAAKVENARTMLHEARLFAERESARKGAAWIEALELYSRIPPLRERLLIEIMHHPSPDQKPMQPPDKAE